jgi:glycosyltransferase involved in cell wall biosynthesis
MSNQNHKNRIACYALSAKNAGSLASANFLMLEELLKRGHEIDFYAIKNFNLAEDLINYNNFNYLPVEIRFAEKVLHILELMPKKGLILYYAWAIIRKMMLFKLIAKTANQNNNIKNYDLLLVLGLPSFFRIKGVPTISWLQGTFQTEWQCLIKLKDKFISLCGIGEYLKLQLFYTYQRLESRQIVKNTDVFICGSQWSKQMLHLWGIDQNRLKALAYPIDLDMFKVRFVAPTKEQGKTTFLWLGRIVPRKRLDLLLEAFAMLIEEGRNVNLKIIGNFAYGKGYKKLIDNFKFPDFISYQEGIERWQVTEIINSVDVLIQPSECENFGSSVAEALSCGVPAIVGATNGTKDYISASSFIFQDYAASCLKETMVMAIDALVKNRELISSEARSTAEKEFDLVKIVDQLEALFTEVKRK